MKSRLLSLPGSYIPVIIWHGKKVWMKWDKIVYVNVMANMSVDCDCCAIAEDPCMKDIGILVSTDPVAIDRACIDLVKQSDDPGKEHFLERVTSRNGEHTIDAACELGIGVIEYELIAC